MPGVVGLTFACGAGLVFACSVGPVFACGVGAAVPRVARSVMVNAAVRALPRERVVMRAGVHEPRVQRPGQ